jgi:hypothetical protein
MLNRLLGGGALALALALPASAQTGAEPPAIDPARIIRASEATDRPFADPGNAAAKSVAEAEGISVGEATSRLRRQWALNQFIKRLQQRNPDLFSFAALRGGEVAVGLTDPSVDISALLPPGLAQVRKVPAKHSRQGMYRKLDALVAELKRAGLPNVTVGVDPESGRVEFVTKTDAAAVEAAVKRGAITVPDGYKVTEDEIVLTGALYGGRSYNVDLTTCSAYCGGTTGFSLISTTGTARYVSTAGHVNNGRARYNTSLTSEYSGGGTTVTHTQDLLSSASIDIQYAAPSSPDSNYPNPYFWDGSVYQTVTGATNPVAGQTYCKFGREAGRDCGVQATPGAYSNSTWGAYYLEIVNKPASQSCSSFIAEGDSGGPVFYGTLAVGWVHGYYKESCNMLYSTYSAFRSVQGAVDVIASY